MAKELKCVLCGGRIEEEFGKLKGTMVGVKEGNKKKFIYVCSECQKTENWKNDAVIKGA